jgi:hypothetical protein
MDPVWGNLLDKAARGSLNLAVSASRGAISKHCRHCTGVNASCACNHGCKPRPTTECSSSISWKHCHHCRGTTGVECTCDQGCLARLPTGCLHHVTCNRCGVHAFAGPCYHCRHTVECPDYDLCQNCYLTGEHGMHSFTRIDYPGAVPVILQAQRPSGSVSTGACCGTKFVPSRASDLPTALPATEPEIEYVVHAGVQCDNCLTYPIGKGERSKCTICPDFDLCQPCNAQGIHQDHSFMRFINPGGPPVTIPARVCTTTTVVQGTAVVETAVNDPPQVATTPPAIVRRTVQTEASCFPPEATVSPTSVTSHPFHQVVQRSPPLPLDADMIIKANIQFMYMTSIQTIFAPCAKAPVLTDTRPGHDHAPSDSAPYRAN